MKLNVKKLTKDAKLPVFANPGDAGMDLYSAESLQIKKGERKIVKTGIAVEIPKGYVGLIWDKSGRAAKEGLHILAGVIDSSYRGEIMVVSQNLSQKQVRILKGEKIAQMLIQKVENPKISEVKELGSTQRGKGGFGSTGKK